MPKPKLILYYPRTGSTVLSRLTFKDNPDLYHDNLVTFFSLARRAEIVDNEIKVIQMDPQPDAAQKSLNAQKVAILQQFPDRSYLMKANGTMEDPPTLDYLASKYEFLLLKRRDIWRMALSFGIAASTSCWHWGINSNPNASYHDRYYPGIYDRKFQYFPFHWDNFISQIESVNTIAAKVDSTPIYYEDFAEEGKRRRNEIGLFPLPYPTEDLLDLFANPEEIIKWYEESEVINALRI